MNKKWLAVILIAGGVVGVAWWFIKKQGTPAVAVPGSGAPVGG